MKKFIFWLFIFLTLPVFVSTSRADILISTPRIDGINSNNIEQGATFRITFSYKNERATAVNVTGAKIYFNYTAQVDDLTEAQIIDYRSDLDYKAVSSYTPASGQVRYQKGRTSPGGINVLPNGILPLFGVAFHVKKTATGTVNLTWVESGISILEETGNAAGTVAAAPTYQVITGAAPSFDGLDSDGGVYDGDRAAKKSSVGNTITLKWSTNRDSASTTDLSNGAETYYGAGEITTLRGQRLRYHVYRNDTHIAQFLDQGTYRDGDASGIPATGLKDGTAYTYKVTAVDNTDGGTNPNDLDDNSSNPYENDTTVQTITPTDTTPPANGSLSVSPGDGKLILSWTKPGDTDYDGVVIIKNVGSPVGAGSLGGANPTTFAHGPIYNVGNEPFGTGNGKVFYVGPTPPTEDTGLQNGTVYYYKAFAYDKAVGSTPGVDLVQMGRNYSGGVTASAAPGVAPDAVANFYAISRKAENEITLKWDNSADLSRPQGGTVIWYTTDIAGKWTNIPNTPSGWPNSVTARKINLLRIEPRTDENETSEAIVLSQDAAGTALSTAETYFFKAFTYNKTPTDLTADALNDVNVIGTYRFSEPRYAAAAPTIGGITVATGTKTFSFKGPVTDTKKPGINTFSIPFVEITSPPGLKTAEDFVKAVNSAAGKNVVTIFAYWDNVEKTFKGGKISYTDDTLNHFDDDGKTRIRLSAVGELVSDRNYQITVKKDVSLTIEGIYIK